MSAKAAIRNKTWAELKVGDTAGLERACSLQDLFLFAHVSGNVNPLMLPPAEGNPDKTEPVAPAMWVGSLVSAVLGNILPGPGTLYREQNLRFLRRVRIGDKVKVTVACREKREAPVATFDTKVEDMDGQSRLRRRRRHRSADRQPGDRSAPSPGADRRHGRPFRQAHRSCGETAALEDGGRLPGGPQFAWRRAALGREGADRAHPHRRPRSHPGRREGSRSRHFGRHDRSGLRSARGRRQGGRDGARRPCGRRDEGRNPLGRAARGSGQEGRGPAHACPHQPCLRHGRADARRDPLYFGRRHQHRARPHDQNGHRAERG